LESIYFLSRLKSFRAPDDLLIRVGADYFNLQAKVQEQKLEAVVAKNTIVRRVFKINDQKVKRTIWQSYKTVLFVPNDLNLFILGPATRRKFLDEILSQKSKEYSLALISLGHILKQKAALLEVLNQGSGDVSELESWNEQLTQSSRIIEQHRYLFIDFINQRFKHLNQELTGLSSRFLVEFISMVAGLDEQGLLAKLSQYQEAEIKSGQCLVGPHRDDFVIKKDEVLNIFNSSRGELRTQVLTLKLLEAEYLSDDKQKPIILLDDVFSELDEIRRAKLIENLKGYQIFITSTEEHHLPKLSKEALVLKVENNAII